MEFATLNLMIGNVAAIYAKDYELFCPGPAA
jgi:hypothetical protein